MSKPRLEVLPIEKGATPDNQNINKHTQKGGGLLENELRKRGAFRSIASAGKDTETPVVYAGNYTLEKAIDAGYTEVVNVYVDGTQIVNVVRTDIAPNTAEAIALGISDNEIGKQSYNPDIDLLASMTAGDSGILSQLKNDDKVFGSMLEWIGIKEETKDAEPQIDRAQELLEKWQVKTGDLWQIGEHRLLCGDSTKREDVDKVMQGNKAQMCFTSPPYANQRKEQYGGVLDTEYVVWWNSIQKEVFFVLSENGSFFINIKPHCDDNQRVLYVFDLVLSMVRSWKWMFIDELCWVRQSMPNGTKYRFRNGFEPVYHFSKKIPFSNFQDMRTIASEMTLPKRYRKSGSGSGLHNFDYSPEEGALPDNVIMINTGEVNIGTTHHPATFPVRLPEFFITGFSTKDDLVYEPFAGSGTTTVACENLSRKCRAIEISPAYCSVILERMSTAFPHLEIKLLQ